jgi:hypothetical protein
MTSIVTALQLRILLWQRESVRRTQRCHEVTRARGPALVTRARGPALEVTPLPARATRHYRSEGETLTRGATSDPAYGCWGTASENKVEYRPSRDVRNNPEPALVGLDD